MTSAKVFWVLVLVSLCSATSILGRVMSIQRDKMYLPDQADYLKSWTIYCETDNLIYWPEDRQCYPEATRGPCFVNEVILLDRLRLIPFCAQEQAEPVLSTLDLTATNELPARSKG